MIQGACAPFHPGREIGGCFALVAGYRLFQNSFIPNVNQIYHIIKIRKYTANRSYVYNEINSKLYIHKTPKRKLYPFDLSFLILLTCFICSCIIMFPWVAHGTKIITSSVYNICPVHVSFSKLFSKL